MTGNALSIDALSAEVEDASAEDAFLVDVEGYEGPLHLLLELARRQKVDLRKISVLALAEQYIAFIDDAKSRRIDLAADYLLMASWLAFMKSRLLLPKPEVPDEAEADPESMAEALAFRLRRLNAMRDAGEALLNGPILDNVVFLRGAPEQPKVIRHTEYKADLWQLTQAFGTIRNRKEEAAPHVIEHQFILPLEAARDRLLDLSKLSKSWASLDDLKQQMVGVDPEIPTRSVTASVFSAALELTRDGAVDLRQDGHFAPLYLRGASTNAGEATV